jgi:hypothetical protein
VGEGDDPNGGTDIDEHDGIRESSQQRTANAEALVDARVKNEPCGSASDRRQDCVDLRDELSAQPFATFIIPCGRGGQLLLGFRF